MYEILLNYSLLNLLSPILYNTQFVNRMCCILLLVVLFPISFCCVCISLYWCTDGISICYYLHCCIFNPESKYSTPQLLTSDSRYSYLSHTQYTSCLLWTLAVWSLATVACNLHRVFYYIPQTYHITYIAFSQSKCPSTLGHSRKIAI